LNLPICVTIPAISARMLSSAAKSSFG
jgi:hypothetical protein